MKQKNLVKKALFPAIIALLCSFVALTSVSYAWFTLGDTASVDGMDMTVTSAGGLQISAKGDEGTFKSDLVVSDLEAAGYDVSLDQANPISTAGKVVDGKIAFFTGTMDNGVLKSTETKAATTNYIVFDIYVKVTADKSLQLDAGSVVKNSGAQETHLSTRVAFVNLGNAVTASAAKALNTESESSIKIWEPNALIRATAVKNAGNTSDGSKQSYEGIASVSGTTPTTAAVTTFAPTQDADFETTVATELFAIKAGYNKIRVYIWLEGQDVDCVNEVSGGNFTITLKFRQA